MPKYKVRFKAEAYAYVSVEADDTDSAEDKAYEHVPTICGRCSGWGTDGISMELGEFELDSDDTSDPPIELIANNEKVVYDE